MNSAELKKLRLSLNMTQKSMAMMCGVPLITYENWERNSVSRPVSRLLELLWVPKNRDEMMRLALKEVKTTSEAE